MGENAPQGIRREYAPTKKDYFEMIVSIFLMSFGVVLSVKAGLGSSPISSLPYVVTLATGVSLGTTMLVVYSFFVLLQWVLLRDRKIIPSMLTQIPFTILFSIFVDIIVYALEPWHVVGVAAQWVVMVLSTMVVAIGIVLEIDANVSMLADDGLVLAIHCVTKLSIGKSLILFDILFILSAFAASLLIFDGFVGVGLGTIFMGITQGLFVNVFSKFVRKYVRPDGHLGSA